MEAQRAKVEACVLSIIHLLGEAKISVEDYKGPESLRTLIQLINDEGLIGKFRELDSLVIDNASDPEIPISILELIDRGYNPDIHIKDMKDRGLQDTQAAKSTLMNLESFSKTLEAQMKELWGDELPPSDSSR